MSGRLGVLSVRTARVSSTSDASQRKRRANEFMRAGLAHEHAPEEIPFFCECGGEQCFHTVWLTKSEYDFRRPNAQWRPIAEEHHATDLPTLRRTVAGRED
jgi:hypothetical protein